jgi:hypothetical protein
VNSSNSPERNEGITPQQAAVIAGLGYLHNIFKLTRVGIMQPTE